MKNEANDEDLDLFDHGLRSGELAGHDPLRRQASRAAGQSPRGHGGVHR